LQNSQRNKFLKENYGFEKWNPTTEDLEVVQEVLDNAIQQNEFNFLKSPVKKSIQDYYRQYVPYLNEKGVRIIEINAFCKIPEIPPLSESKSKEWTKMDWKKEYIEVTDGGNCYWQVKINVDKKEYTGLMRNSKA
jgi:hypothetical protein